MNHEAQSMKYLPYSLLILTRGGVKIEPAKMCAHMFYLWSLSPICSGIWVRLLTVFGDLF